MRTPRVDALRAELTKAESDMEQAARYLPPLLLQAIVDSIRTVIDAIDDYTKFEARLFAEAIHARLPRELRDIVYAFF